MISLLERPLLVALGLALSLSLLSSCQPGQADTLASRQTAMAGSSSPGAGSSSGASQQVEGNYWYKIDPSDEQLYQEALQTFRGLVEGSGLFKPFADITPQKDPSLTWDKLTELEKRQVMEVRMYPIYTSHLINKAMMAGDDPTRLTWEELYRKYNYSESGTVPPSPINLFQHRPVRLFSRDPSPGDLYIRVLTPEETREFLKANPMYGEWYPAKNLDCPDYYTVAYWRLYGEGGRLIIEAVDQIGLGDPDINCP